MVFKIGKPELDDPRRRLLVQAMSASVAGLWLPGASMAQGFLGRRRLPEGKSIFSLSGKVTINGTAATTDTRIKPGDVIETGPSSAIIFAIEGRAMIVRANSRLELEGGDGVGSTILAGLRLLTGKLLSVSRSARTQLRTQTATIGIRGTGWYAESDPEQTYFCTCYGATDIAANDDPSSTLSVAASHHDSPVYILSNAGAGRSIRDAPFINHTDQELMLIESIVGREPPFVFPGDDYGGPRRDY